MWDRLVMREGGRRKDGGSFCPFLFSVATICPAAREMNPPAVWPWSGRKVLLAQYVRLSRAHRSRIGANCHDAGVRARHWDQERATNWTKVLTDSLAPAKRLMIP